MVCKVNVKIIPGTEPKDVVTLGMMPEAGGKRPVFDECEPGDSTWTVVEGGGYE